MMDISYPMMGDMAIYPGNPGDGIRRVQSVEAGDSATVAEVVFGTHTGTHIDVPCHVIDGGEPVDKIALDRMNGRARVIDLTGHADIDASLLEKYSIEEESIVLLKTDNSLIWHCDRILDSYVTLTYDGAGYIADHGVSLVGIDYLTIERPRGRREADRSVHKLLMRRGVLICKGLNLKDVQEGEYTFHCLPLKICGADGCPVRVVLEH